MTTDALVKGVLVGLRSPLTAVRPPKLTTRTDPWVRESSYRSPQEDLAHLGRYFGEAIACARQDRDARKFHRKHV